MYRYDEFDQAFVRERVAQFRDQVDAPLSGELTRTVPAAPADERRLPAAPRLHAADRDSLRHAESSAAAHARPSSRANTTSGYGHFTTRQNIQFNWPQLKDVPDILADLASVEMHAIQTSGNCIRNVTADHFAGAAADEIVDPRPYAEILRQWSSAPSGILFLPRKFKIAVTGAERDRAAIQFHDIGLQVKRNAERRARLRRLCRRRAGPHADDRPRRSATSCPRRTCSPTRGDPARLQPLRPPRQQVQGAHQDPRPRDRRRGDRAPGRGGVARS